MRFGGCGYLPSSWCLVHDGQRQGGHFYLEESIVELDDLGGKDLGLRLASKR